MLAIYETFDNACVIFFRVPTHLNFKLERGFLLQTLANFLFTLCIVITLTGRSHANSQLSSTPISSPFDQGLLNRRIPKLLCPDFLLMLYHRLCNFVLENELLCNRLFQQGNMVYCFKQTFGITYQIHCTNHEFPVTQVFCEQSTICLNYKLRIQQKNFEELFIMGVLGNLKQLIPHIRHVNWKLMR